MICSAPMSSCRACKRARTIGRVHCGVEFEAVLQQLSSDPVDPSRRAAVVAEAGEQVQHHCLGLTRWATACVSMRRPRSTTPISSAPNSALTRAGSGSGDPLLLGQRDQLLERLGGFSSLTTSFAADGTWPCRWAATRRAASCRRYG